MQATFERAVSRLFARLGVSGIYRLADGREIATRFVAKQADVVESFGDTRLALATHRFDVMARDVASPREGERFTVAHADALLKATPPEQRTDFKPTERDRQLAPIEQIVKLEKEMSQVQTQYKDAEENYGSDLLNLVVAKGYLTKLLGNEAVKSYITRHEPEILEHFELVVNTVSMEEAVQQQLEADGEFEEPPEDDVPEQKGAE